MADLTNVFVREIEVLNSNLEIHQAVVGDVGCVVWDAAIVIAKYLEKTKKEEIAGKVVLELGAGTGAVGLCCAVLGAKVISSDLKELVPLLELNKKVNETHLGGNYEVLELKWGESLELLDIPDLDYLIMSDVIYYVESLKSLVDTICKLAHKKTEVLMSYEQRLDGNKPFL